MAEASLGAPGALRDGEFYSLGPATVDNGLSVEVTAAGTKEGVVKVRGTQDAGTARSAGFAFVDRRVCGPAGKAASPKRGRAGSFRSNGTWVATYVCA